MFRKDDMNAKQGRNRDNLATDLFGRHQPGPLSQTACRRQIASRPVRPVRQTAVYRRSPVAIGGAVMLLYCLSQPAPAAAPRVVRAVPDNADIGVDPALAEVRFEFDQDMNTTGGHSICGGGPAFPKLNGKPSWKDPRTLIMPVKLEPGHTYSFSVNCPAAQNTRSAAGVPAEVFPVTFKTAADGEAPAKPLTPESNKTAAEKLLKALDAHYSYRDRLKIDWPARLKEFGPRFDEAQTVGGFSRAAAEYLSAAQDIHISVRVGDIFVATHRRMGGVNFDVAKLKATVRDLKDVNRSVVTGVVGEGADESGYILINNWERSREKDFDALYPLLEELQKSPRLIIDVRPNGGGDERLAREFAGCFLEKAGVYSQSDVRAPAAKDGFGPRHDRTVEPSKGRPAYRGKVAVLIGPANMSSNESFIFMMKLMPGCKLVGEKTYGSSGNPKPHELGNGVTVLLPSWRDYGPDGRLLEGVGIAPDIEIKWDARSSEDVVIRAAQKALQ